jgi:alginate O-acetyltransferase complex protein AlgI
MSFTSLHFLLFFPLAVLVYYLLPYRWRWVFLLLVSYAFYINWHPIYALVLVGVTVVSYFSGLLIQRSEHGGRGWLAVGIVLTLASLVFFKYSNFINDSVSGALSWAGVQWKMPQMKLLMPVGISFYTFMAVGYMVDVYRRTVVPERNFPMYALFLSFFPQVTSGPIGRAGQLIPQLREPGLFSRDNVIVGLKMMLWGYFMKLCVADRCGAYVDAVFGNLSGNNGTTYLLAAVSYTIQIYCDFAGYSLIAIGAARMMGIRLMENFRRPYFSRSVKEFWSRWHISLSTWLRDYVYIPLGGNRVSEPRYLLNLLLTFLVSGLWHGAAWTFVVWGGLYGLFLIVEALFRRHLPGLNLPGWLKWGLTMFCVCMAWIVFRSPDLPTAWTVTSGIFSSVGKPFFTCPKIALCLLVLKELHDEFGWKVGLVESRSWVISYLSMAALAVYIVLFGMLDGGQFIYFKF